VFKTRSTLVLLAVGLLAQRPAAQEPATARIFFVDIGTGAGTLIVGPTGKTLLVDGGPSGAGNTRIVPLLTTLGITAIDFTVLSHYHIDHDSGLTEVFNAGRVSGGIAFDNGDAPGLIPPNPNGTTFQAYTAYRTAVAAGGATRQTILPGQVIDLGGGMTATCLAAGGRLLSGGSVTITDEDLNSESISLLVQFHGFSFIVSGDLTGGGSTSTEKAPDVETWVAQLAGDVDVVQLNHHGSTTASNQKFLNALRAEVAVAETGTGNSFGHPNRETVNKYLNTPVSDGHVFSGPGVPAPGDGPLFYQIEQSSTTDDRQSQQGYSGAPASSPGTGTLLLRTDGLTSYTMMSFDDGGTRIDPALHTYALDAASTSTTDFAPTVIPAISPAAPLATEAAVVSAQVMDRESAIADVTLSFSLNGVLQKPIVMAPSGGLFVATIPAQPDGTRVDYTISGRAGSQTTTYASGYFSGVTTIGALRELNANGEPAQPAYPARVRGVVTAGSGFFVAGTYDDYLDDGTGAINVFRAINGVSTFTPLTNGQTVEAVGHLETFAGRLRLDLSDSVEKTSSPWRTTVLANPVSTPAPLARTIAQLNAAPESFEGKLVSIANAAIVSGTLPSPPQQFDASVEVSDGTGNFVMKIDNDTDIAGFAVPSTFTIVGIVQQDDFLRPFDAGYDIVPRNRVDLGAPPPPPPPLLTITDARVDVVDNVTKAPGPDLVPDRAGQVVRVRGTVTSINFRPTATEYYLQDATAGIDIFAPSTSFGSFDIGTTLEVAGTVTHFSGVTELTVASATPTGAAPPPAPRVVTLSQLADGGVGEALEGLLIRVNDVSVTSGAFPPAGGSGNVTISDATGSAILRIDSDTNIDGTPAPAGPFAVVGLVSQFDASAPFDNGYQVFPRALSDIGRANGVVISEFRFRGPNGGNDEFVELYNGTAVPIDIGGWKLKGSNNAGTVTTRATIANGVSIPAHGHFLFANNNAAGGYSGSVAANHSYATGITDDGGIAITTAADVVIDQAGSSAGSAFKEGSPLTPLGSSNLNRSYERKPGGVDGSTQDTGSNAADFVIRTPSDPQNLASAVTPAIVARADRERMRRIDARQEPVVP
jgi:beta-lactamase superfamily II metal-dependent hydrolase